MKKNIAVIGLGRFGIDLCLELSKNNNINLVAIDEDKEAINFIAEYVDQAFVCDCTKLASLKEIGLQDVDHAIIAIGQNDSQMLVSTITTTIILKKLGVPKITVRLDDETYSETLLDIGATMIVTPMKMAAERLATRLVLDNIVDYFKISEDYNVFNFKISEEAEEISIMELNSPQNYKVNILLIKRDNKVFPPTKDDVISSSDEIFVFGKKGAVLKLEAFFNK